MRSTSKPSRTQHGFFWHLSVLNWLQPTFKHMNPNPSRPHFVLTLLRRFKPVALYASIGLGVSLVFLAVSLLVVEPGQTMLRGVRSLKSQHFSQPNNDPRYFTDYSLFASTAGVSKIHPMTKLFADPENTIVVACGRVGFGLPFSMAHVDVELMDGDAVVIIDDGTLWGARIVPTGISAAGAVANSAVFGVISFLLVPDLSIWRSRKRVKSGRCRGCAYCLSPALSTVKTCPECGLSDPLSCN